MKYEKISVSGFMILTIASSYTASPKDQENSSDGREPGISLKSVRILEKTAGL